MLTQSLDKCPFAEALIRPFFFAKQGRGAKQARREHQKPLKVFHSKMQFEAVIPFLPVSEVWEGHVEGRGLPPHLLDGQGRCPNAVVCVSVVA